MKRKITKKTVNHAIKVIKLYVEQNPQKYKDQTRQGVIDTRCKLGEWNTWNHA